MTPRGLIRLSRKKQRQRVRVERRQEGHWENKRTGDDDDDDRETGRDEKGGTLTQPGR